MIGLEQLGVRPPTDLITKHTKALKQHVSPLRGLRIFVLFVGKTAGLLAPSCIRNSSREDLAGKATHDHRSDAACRCRLLLPDDHRPRDRPPAHDRDLVCARRADALHALRWRRQRRLGEDFLRAPEVAVRIAEVTWAGRGRVVERAEEDALARRIVVANHQPRYTGDLTDWGITALPVAVDLTT